MQEFARNPILNTPYDPPALHWELDGHGQPTGVPKEGRRPHRYVIPVAASRRRTQQGALALDTEIADNTLVTSIRPQVDAWRRLPPSQWNVTPETERLLRWWRDRTVRELPFFFCQIEAVETIVWLAEAAPKSFRDQIEAANATANPGLFRIAAKMATGSGKTTVMAMLIAWQAVNAARRPNSPRYASGFLIVTPGITIRDRLRVLKPEEPDNYFDDPKRRIVPPELSLDLRKARVVITNFHAFQPRETVSLSPAARRILGTRGAEKRFPESEGAMVERVAKELGGLKRIVVINDEAHHCYREKPGESEEDGTLDSEAKSEAEANAKAARIWISGIEALARRHAPGAIYDLSATPFFLRGSGYPEGTLFPWVVSDFSLMDAIECGIVKTPRLPVLDDSVLGDMPKYRELYANLPPNALPKKGRRTGKKNLDPEDLDELLRGALEALYRHYEETATLWNQAQIGRPPVFIVVANNTATSKLIYDFIAGYDLEEPVAQGDQDASSTGRAVPAATGSARTAGRKAKRATGKETGDSNRSVRPDPVEGRQPHDVAAVSGPAQTVSPPPPRTRTIPGRLKQFSNVDDDGRWLHRPRTILIDSEALEAGDSLPDDFRKAASREIEDFRKEVSRREGAAAAEKLSDAQILREVMNTVGQPGRLGGDIRCVVSVSMLTEGWDANTVSHILGVRAFGTQLLCEQVVGRGLRRVSYQPGEDGRLRPEYADVLGVPFDFTPSPTAAPPTAPPKTTRVRALPEREKDCEIRFPNVDGYRVAYPPGPLVARFTGDSKLTVTPDDVPTQTDVEPIVGEGIRLTLDNYATQRMKSVHFAVAGYTLRRYFREDGKTKDFRDGEEPAESAAGQIPLYRFGQLLGIVERWFAECLTCHGANPEHLKRLFLWRPLAQRAAEKIARACAPADGGQDIVRVIANPYNEWGSTRHVDFATSKELFATDPSLCHVEYVVADQDWEKAFAEAIERELRDVTIAYVKNHALGFEVPYEYRGELHRYRPDFIVKLNDGRGRDDALHLVVEVKGQRDEQDAAKAETMRTRWIPGVNAARTYGRWAFLECTNPYNFAREVRAMLDAAKRTAA